MKDNLNSNQSQIPSNESAKKPKGHGGLAFFLTLLSLGCAAGIGYGVYRYVKNTINNFSNNQIKPINPNDFKINGKNGYLNSSIKSFNSKLEKDLKINDRFEYGHLSIIEYPIGIDKNEKPVYFLGEEGRKKLDELFQNRAVFGPEINALRNVYINRKYSGELNKEVNGFYLPGVFDIYLFSNSIFEGDTINYQILNWDAEKRAEMILSVLVHEYTHHIDNIYNRSIKNNDSLANNELEYKLSNKQIVKENNANNKKFLHEFRENLSYYLPLGQSNAYFLKNPTAFKYKLINQNPVFQNLSSYDLFKFANLDLTATEIMKFKSQFSKNLYFNNSNLNGINFINATTEDQVKYLYSFEELVPRELLKMSFTSNSKFYNPQEKIYRGYLYFDKPDKKSTYLSAIGDDILKMYVHDNKEIFSTNWVFDNELKGFRNAEDKLIFKNIAKDLRLKGLFKAYIDLMGYGQAISYIGADNWKWQFDDKNSTIQRDHANLNFGGYLKLDKNYVNKKMALLLTNQNKASDYQKIAIHKSNFNFVAKKAWNSDISATYNVDWIYPFSSQEKDKYTYFSYFSDSIDIETLNKYSLGKKLDIKLWIDENSDNKMSDNEIKDFLNDANNNYFDVQERSKRRVTSFRKYMDHSLGLWTQEYSYQLNIKKGAKTYFEWDKY